MIYNHIDSEQQSYSYRFVYAEICNTSLCPYRILQRFFFSYNQQSDSGVDEIDSFKDSINCTLCPITDCDLSIYIFACGEFRAKR